jgi:hypothetical protein
MDKELKDKLESLKADIPVKKKPCKDCKKKKETITKLPELIEEEVFYIPTREEIMLAYVELGSKGTDKHPFINKVYKALFNEDFDFFCASCVNRQGRKLKNFIESNLNTKL